MTFDTPEEGITYLERLELQPFNIGPQNRGQVETGQS